MDRKTLLDLIFNQQPKLATPTISLSDSILSIEEVKNAEYYDIYVDGVLEESVRAKDEFNNITISFTCFYSATFKFRVNDGSWVTIDRNSATTSYTLNNVKKLEVSFEGVDNSESSATFTSDITTLEDDDVFDLSGDITDILSDGTYIGGTLY